MQGYKLSFFTQQDRSVQGHSLAPWLLEQARNLGVRGATLFAANEGFGHDRRLHSVHFLELSDQPLEVTLAVTPCLLCWHVIKKGHRHVRFTAGHQCR